MSDNDDEVKARAVALDDLIHLRGTVEDLATRVRDFNWDAAPNLVALTPGAVIEVLSRYVSGEVTAKEIETWADAIEGREDIALPPLFQPVLSTLIFELANPEITRSLTVDSALDWSARLREEPE